MTKINFYLDKRPKKNLNTHRIYLKFSIGKSYFKFSTKHKIELGNWDARKQRVKSKYPKSRVINSVLNFLENKLQEIVNEYQVKNLYESQDIQLDIKEIKKTFLAFMNPSKASKKRKKSTRHNAANPVSETIQEETPPLVITDLFQGFIREKSSKYNDSTLRVFRRVRKNLDKFKEHSGESLNVNNIDVKFQRKYERYLIEELKYANSTIGSEFKKIHAVLTYYSEEHQNNSFKKFKIPTYQAKRFICTHEEVLKLYKYKPKSDHLLKARDCAVFSFFTGLSYADLSEIQESNLIEDTLNGEKIKVLDFKRRKTKRYNQIPLNSICLEIIECWRGKQGFDRLLPAYQNDQTMNKYLHELMKESGYFNQEVQSVKESGKKRIVTYLPRWKAITFHSFRHGYASYLASEDVNPVIIQKLMGHANLETTMIYIQINRKKVFEAALEKLEK